MTPRAFSVTYDYRCPFARNIHEHLVVGLDDGAPWEVDFAPFSLTQAHVEEGAPAVWDDPEKGSHLLAIEAGLVVRDIDPEHFGAVHVALFAARHDDGRDLREEAVVRDVLATAGVDADKVLAEVATGAPREAFRLAHEEAVRDHHVFGVPTFVTGDRAVFVRVMNRPRGDGAEARRTIDGVLQLLEDHPELNEYKFTSIPR
jgi:DSBA-like thioredoxin domain